MFGFFRQKKPYKVVDKVWISKQAKWNACAKMLALNPGSLFIAWFPDTQREMKTVLGETAPVYLVDQLGSIPMQGKMLMFAEHYPLSRKEEVLFETLGLKEIPVLSGLDEPIFIQFGGERMIEMMKRFGMDDNEPVGHSMITKSIVNAQRKLEQRVKAEQTARSQEEWFDLNVHA
jgi:hypothetical protein